MILNLRSNRSSQYPWRGFLRGFPCTSGFSLNFDFRCKTPLNLFVISFKSLFSSLFYLDRVSIHLFLHDEYIQKLFELFHISLATVHKEPHSIQSSRLEPLNPLTNSALSTSYPQAPEEASTTFIHLLHTSPLHGS